MFPYPFGFQSHFSIAYLTFQSLTLLISRVSHSTYLGCHPCVSNLLDETPLFSFIHLAVCVFFVTLQSFTLYLAFLHILTSPFSLLSCFFILSLLLIVSLGLALDLIIIIIIIIQYWVGVIMLWLSSIRHKVTQCENTHTAGLPNTP